MAPPIQHLELPRHPGAAVRAREATSRFLGEAVHRGQKVTPAAADITLLVVSELVTNAVRHTRGPCVLDLAVSDGAIWIGVTDTSPTPPRPSHAHHTSKAPADGAGSWSTTSPSTSPSGPPLTAARPSTPAFTPRCEGRAWCDARTM
ncbi:ATP-binding protein [Streptomyces goshikiensis]|uniref:ATP-binding protein n=1 Tax=Streptomyces goshikiensis TaxID=1942 RepID=UPI0033C90912